jgi:hypothetical protein
MLGARAKDNADVGRLNPAGEAVNAVGQLTAVIGSGAHALWLPANLSPRNIMLTQIGPDL